MLSSLFKKGNLSKDIIKSAPTLFPFNTEQAEYKGFNAV